MTQASDRDRSDRQLLVDGGAFFDDHELLAALETSVVPRLFAEKSPGAPLRVWVPGCGTGAAAYAIAILLCEYAGRLASPVKIRIFATDANEVSIAIARKGLYPATIQTAIPPERLWRFFGKQHQQYQINKAARDLVTFAAHDLLQDPPFTRLDLLACANALSAFDQGTQEQLLRVFHYALRPDGYLALGVGERTRVAEDLFMEVDGIPRLFRRRNGVPKTALTLPWLVNIHQPSLAAPLSDVASASSVRDLHLRLLAQHSATSVLIDNRYLILHLSKRDSRLFHIPMGHMSLELLDIIDDELRPLLRAALLSAARGAMVETPPMWVSLNGTAQQIRILVRQLHEPEWARGYFLVIFDEQADDRARGDGDARVARQPEVDRRQGQSEWQLAIDQYEIAIESQRSANDELRSMNEELQALAEELQTSQEQLSTTNEQLLSSNNELRRRVMELARVNNDLNNLIGATDIATIFLDAALKVTRFTPHTQSLFNLTPADRGRPLGHITHNLDYDQLLPDAANVLRALQNVEREVRSMDGRWHLARLRPYRTADERIEGVVLTFVDITTRKQSEEALRQARDQLEQRVAERTRDLETINLHLQGEIAERMRLEEARKELMRELVTLQENERRRIARELHDQLGQSVSALSLGLAFLANPNIEARLHQQTLTGLQEIAVQIDKDMNRLALDLRPAALDDLGMVAAVQYHVERWAERSQIHAEFQASGLDTIRVPSEIQSVVYRVVQEALTNVVKHARAERVSVILEQRNNLVNVIVEDDGCGFDFEALQQSPNAQRRLGLLGMQERLALVGGTFAIDTAPRVGTTLFARIPIGPDNRPS